MKTATVTWTDSETASGPEDSPGGPGGRSGPPPTHIPHTEGPDGLGYCLWQFDGAEWQLKKNCALGGAVVSNPPTAPGKFRGQIRSIGCTAV